MGKDKAAILIDGVPQAQRIANSLWAHGISVTVLGREAICGHAFLPDVDEFAGPLSALARFKPTADAVFVCSCDLPLFDSNIVPVLLRALGDKDASVPMVNGFRQPLCALYRSQAFAEIANVLPQEGACAMRWLDTLDHAVVSEVELAAAGLDSQCAQGANTRAEFERMLAAASRSK
jgi:molybdopterin-guanine dinucleotide biosynthesis protein A